jgi:hypothetical protein
MSQPTDHRRPQDDQRTEFAVRPSRQVRPVDRFVDDGPEAIAPFDGLARRKLRMSTPAEDRKRRLGGIARRCTMKRCI